MSCNHDSQGHDEEEGMMISFVLWQQKALKESVFHRSLSRSLIRVLIRSLSHTCSL